MNIFLAYFRDFLKTTHSGLLVYSLVFTACIVFLNYYYNIETKILYNIPERWLRFAGFYIVYLVAFSIPYLIIFLVNGSEIKERNFLLIMIFFAPAVFALKVTFNGVPGMILHYIKGPWGRYLAIISNLPSKLIVVLIALAFTWWLGKYQPPFCGVTVSNLKWSPYLFMVLLMVPLVAWASTQPDFLNAYPKLKQLSFLHKYTKNKGWYNLLFEISYGIDFLTIELFFRGFLVLAFVRFAGRDAIIPMAVFYCSIHFGKPLAECISSFFGGLLLGIVVYQTNSIAGGLIVHLGIAWMMEVGGYIGNLARK